MDLNPAFPADIEKTLKDRGDKLKTRQRDFNYRRYAYVYLTSLAHGGKDPDSTEDTTSLFELYPKDEFVIGTIPTGGHLDLYDTNSGIRRLKPQLTSVTIGQDGGGDVYNSYIREVDVQFKVYSLSQLENVENSFFRLGSEVELNYGWLNSTAAGERSSLKMSIYNFGFSMSSDGSYDCTLKGLAGDVFPGAQTLGGTLVLNEDEEMALGDGISNPVDISAALMAKWKHAFGLEAGEEASEVGIDNGEIQKKTAAGYEGQPSIDVYMAGIMNTGEEEGLFFGDDPVRTPFITLKDFIALANKLSGGDTEDIFIIGPKAQHQEIGGDGSEKYGSSDPRKYIFPGNMCKYGDDSNYHKVLGGLDTNIENILISLIEITAIVKNKGKTVNDVFQPPKMLDILSDLSQRIANVSGGLVNIIVVPEGDVANDKGGKYLIQNKVKMLQSSTTPPQPFKFVTLGDSAMVKDISIETEFDTDLMLMMTVGNVRNGSIKLDPLQSVYTDIPNVKKSKLNEKSAKEVKDAAKIPSKDSVGKDGIDDARANSISQTMRQSLVSETNPKVTTQPVLPFQLKLSVTLDGIDGIKYLSPITADRLPSRFKKAGVRFVVLGVEHAFDGQGGWTTSLKTAMTMGGV